MGKELSFENLADNVSQIHELTSGKAKNAVNQMLTVRNWAIGYYIVEYEQSGKDRATYGASLLVNLAKKLNIKGLTNVGFMQILLFKIPTDSCHRIKKVGILAGDTGVYERR